MTPEDYANWDKAANEMAATIICRVLNAGWPVREKNETAEDEHRSAILDLIAEVNENLCKRKGLPQAGAVAYFETRERLRKELAKMGEAILTPSNMWMVRDFLSIHKLITAPAPDVLAA